jgi:hypothetical protein
MFREQEADQQDEKAYQSREDIEETKEDLEGRRRGEERVVHGMNDA